jgi:integrase
VGESSITPLCLFRGHSLKDGVSLHAESTKIAYAADWAAWETFCEENGFDPIPGSPESLAMYVHAMHDRPSPRRVSRGQSGGMTSSAIARRFAGIKWYHTAAGLFSPTDHPIAKLAIHEILERKAKSGERHLQADPLLSMDIRKLLDSIGTRKRRDKRDRLLILIGFRAALRRSEIGELHRSDVDVRKESVCILIRRSKTDQAGIGDPIIVEAKASAPAYEIVPALHVWRNESPICGPESALFGSLHGTKTGKHLSGDAIDNVIKYRCKDAGLIGNFSGHSLRRGRIQSLMEEGKTSIQDIMQLVRIRTIAGLMRYSTNENDAKIRLAKRLSDGM